MGEAAREAAREMESSEQRLKGNEAGEGGELLLLEAGVNREGAWLDRADGGIDESAAEGSFVLLRKRQVAICLPDVCNNGEASSTGSRCRCSSLAWTTARERSIRQAATPPREQMPEEDLESPPASCILLQDNRG